MYLTKQKKEDSLKEYSKTLCEGIQPEEQKQKRMKRGKLKGYIGHHQYIKCIYYESSRRKREAESLLGKIMAKNFQNLGKEMDIQIQEAKQIPVKVN